VRRIFHIGAGWALALVLVTCTDQTVTGPNHTGVAALNLAALAPQAGGVPAPVPVESLEITLRRPEDQSLALDSILPVTQATAKGDSAVIKLSVVLRQSPEDFLLSVRAFGAGITWYSASSSVRIGAGAAAIPTALVVQYVGPGASGARVVMAPTDTTGVGGVAFPLRAVVYDSGDKAITGVPVAYHVRDTSLAGVAYPTPYTATFTGKSMVRDSVWVVAETPTHVKDSTRVHIVPPAAALLKKSGDLQSSVVGAALPAPLFVRVLDALGGGLKGDTVRWTVTAGGATLTAAFSVSDDSGYAGMIVTPTVVSAVGGLVVQAAVAGLSGSPVTFTETAITGVIQTVTITPKLDTIANGAALQYTAVARDAGGGVVNTTFGWTSTAGSVASVSSTGLATARAGDSTRIVAAAGGVADTAWLYVRALKSIILSPADTIITAVGDSLLLKASTLDNFRAVTSGANIRFTSVSPSIAVVNRLTGWVKIIGPGDAVILAQDSVATSDSMVRGFAFLHVNQVTAGIINSPKAGVTVGVGGQAQIIATAVDSNGYPIPGKVFLWAALLDVQGAQIATVTSSGMVTGVAIGSTYVVASLIEGQTVFSDTTAVFVSSEPPTLLQWAFDLATVGKGGAVAIGLSVTTPAGPDPLTITIESNDPTIAQAIPNTVTIPAGSSATSVMIYGLATGRAVLRAKDAGGSGKSYSDGQMIVDVVSTVGFRLMTLYKTLTLYLGGPAIPVPVYTADRNGVTIQIKDPIVVGDTSSAPGVAVGDSAAKTIEAGGSYALFNVTGLKEGSGAIVYSSPGYQPDTTRFIVETPQLMLSSDLSVVVGKTTSYISIPFAAPADITVRLSIVGVGLQAPPTVTIPKGSTSVSFDVTGLAGIGTLSASAPGFRDATSLTIQVL